MKKRRLMLPLLLVVVGLTGCSMYGGRNRTAGPLGPAASPLAESHASVAPRRDPVVPASAESPEHTPRDLRRMQVLSAAKKSSSSSSYANCFS